jgi:hypothetical protein
LSAGAPGTFAGVVAEHAEAHAEEAVSTELGERVRAIVAAAEGMAAAMREDAEQYSHSKRQEADEEAERRLREARERADRLVQERLVRMAELSDGIVAQAETVLSRLGQTDEVRRQLDEMVRSLGNAAQQLSADMSDRSGEEPMAEQVRPMRPPGEEERPALRPVEETPLQERDEHLENARLVALQMAVAGRSRQDVEVHLREAFSVEDPEPILDHIFADGFQAPGTSS